MKHIFHYHIHEVAGYINWLYFFHAWEFPSNYGRIAKVHDCEACRQSWIQSFPEDERNRAREAMKLYRDAKQLLSEMEGRFKTHAIVSLFDANGDEEDIVLYTDTGTARLPLLRQQTPTNDGVCLCLSDFVRPINIKGTRDKVAIFASSADQGIEESYPDDNYRHMICQTLADRLAESTAEKVHEETRKKLWGYCPDESLTVEEMFQEKYQGKRPAVGYPSLPDQSLNFLLDNLICMHDIGITLTETGAMIPHASTSGLMISHPATRHFSVGKISEEQLTNYAQRRGITIEQAQSFLASNT